MKKYILTILAVSLFLFSEAQTVTCGTDTIILQVENYKGGLIEWEESLDNEIWVTIPEAIGESYKFFPTETKYYRASVITTDCDPLISETTLVQLPPKAYAGSDRKIAGNTAQMLGSIEVAGTGVWSILNGTGGEIANPADAYSEFTGEFDQDYSLIWTVTNGCGQSEDTISIVFEEVVAKENFIVVDNTDLILGDSTERAAGIYRIKFSDPGITPTDTVLLIGMREDISFIVKIQSFTIENDVYVFNTIVGGLEDIIQSGPANIGDAVNSSMIEDGKFKTAKFPTRETLKQYAKNKGQVVIYSGDYADKYGNRVAISRKSSDSKGLKISVPDMDLFASPDGFISTSISDAYVRFEPNFVCDFDIGLFTINNIKIGLDNAEFEYNYKLTVAATAAKEYSKELELLEISTNIVFMAGPVPVVVTCAFAMKASASLNASAVLTVEEEKNYQKNFTALLMGDKLKNVEFVSFSTSKSTSTSNYMLQGSLDAEFTIGPEISIELYSVIGPYFELPLSLAAGICVNQNLNWSASASLGIEGNLGIRAHLGSWTLFDMKHTLFRAELMRPLVLPYKLALRSGNSQKGFQETLLGKPITLKVSSNYGFGVPFVPVRFWLDEGDGSISDDVKFTDKDGKVIVDDWTLGTNPTSQLEISVLNCDDEDIEKNSPLTAYAYTVFDCSNTDLAISFDKSETSVIPLVTGGTAPYTYSTDGSSFSSTIPQFSNLTEGNFQVYVKDDNLCNSNKALTIKIQDPCTVNPLFIDVYSEANTFRLSGIGGKPPYQFAIDNTSGYSENSLYSNLSEGKHIVYIEDANNCTSSDSIIVEHFDANAINAVKPQNNAQYYTASNINFQWQTGLYAENQTYDIYLKKDSEAYAAIVQNLTVENYTHATTLEFTSVYNWKIVVKDQSGVEKDFREFSFTTMSDPSIVAQVPTLVQPQNDELVNDSTTLKWEKQIGDFKYDVYIDNNLVAYGLTTDSLFINDLTPSMAYSWKVKIKNIISNEALESPDWNFEVKSLLPEVTTNAVMDILDTIAICGGTITSEGLAPVTSRGVCWSKYENPTVDSSHVDLGTGSGFFEDTIPGLEPETVYYVRAYAINSNGISYGVQESFTTKISLPTDGDGNTYTSVIIGTQEWLAENLKTTKYNDGTDIPNITGFVEWSELVTPAYCWYNNDITNKDVYGALYNWYTVDTVSNDKNVCPQGWHVPSYTDYHLLDTYLEGIYGADNVGGALKSVGTWQNGDGIWQSPNSGATNVTGFNGIPAGTRNSPTTFNGRGYNLDLWTVYKSADPNSNFVNLRYNYSTFTTSISTARWVGKSVRCIKD